MKNKWNTTKLIATGSFSVLMLVLLLPGAIINFILGTTVFSAPLNNIVYCVLTMTCLFIIHQFGAATIMFTIFGILALPFPLIGPPGFFFKVPILIMGGFICDLLYFPHFQASVRMSWP